MHAPRGAPRRTPDALFPSSIQVLRRGTERALEARMSFRRALRWTLPPLALLALSGWLASTPLAQRGQQTTAPQMSGRESRPGSGPAVLSTSIAGPDRLSAVQNFVQQKNAESSRQQEEF